MAGKPIRQNVWVLLTGRVLNKTRKQCESYVDVRRGLEYRLWMRVVGPLRNRILDILQERLLG